MNIHFAPEASDPRVRIKVIGVGGAGGNAVNRMVTGGLGDIDFYAVNTDGQALDTSQAHQTLVIGSQLTRGLGAGGDPDLGRRAAEEDRELLAGMVEGADMVFVTAGMGGGTGTGAAPVVAELARDAGALTVAVVTRPFLFEGRRRAAQAETGLTALRDHVDALLVIPNERLMEIDVPDGGMNEVFRLADNVLFEATRGISDIISRHAVVNLDFADVRTVMKGSGAAIMGTGHAGGDDRAARAAEMAITSPLLENVDIRGSRAVLVYLTAGEVTRDDLRGAMNLVQDAAGDDAHVFFGFANDAALGDELQITVIATGFPAAGEAGEGRAAVAATAGGPTPAPTPEAGPAPAMSAEPEPEPEAEPEPLPAPASEAVTETTTPGEDDVATREAARPVTDVPPPPIDPAERVDRALLPDDEEPASAMPEAGTMPTADLAAMAAAAGADPERAPEPPAAEPATPTSETGQRFLEPLGTVKLQDGAQPATAASPTQRFRPSVLGNDKTRPAWERKYVD